MVKEFLKLFTDKTIKESHHLLSIPVLLFSNKIGFSRASTTKYKALKDKHRFTSTNLRFERSAKLFPQ